MVEKLRKKISSGEIDIGELCVARKYLAVSVNPQGDVKTEVKTVSARKRMLRNICKGEVERLTKLGVMRAPMYQTIRERSKIVALLRKSAIPFEEEDSEDNLKVSSLRGYFLFLIIKFI